MLLPEVGYSILLVIIIVDIMLSPPPLLGTLAHLKKGDIFPKPSICFFWLLLLITGVLFLPSLES